MGSISLLDKFCFFLIFFVGLPHGALDGAVAFLVGIKSQRDYIVFAVAYLLCAFAVMVVWYFLPGLSLIMFLAATVFHFGSCDWLNYGYSKNKFLVVFTHGMVVMFGIVFFHEKDSIELFSLLADRPLESYEKLLLIPYVATFTAFSLYTAKAIVEPYLRTGVLEMFVVLTAAYFFSSHAAFALYFCFFHSAKHVKHIFKNLDTSLVSYRQLFFSAGIFTLVAWFMAFIGFEELSSNYSAYESLLKVVFIGLASLTLPHMILVEKFHKEHFILKS